MESYTHTGLTFDVRDEGPPGAPAVVLLHGFPKDSSSWDAVVPPLHAAGLRTLAPDLRGYSPRASPGSRRDYTIDKLVGDVIALLDSAGLQRAHLVGHDWGGGVAWAAAAAHPDRIATLTALSTPHPSAMIWALRHSRQALKSWHMLAFQVPGVPEFSLSRGLDVGLRRLGLPADKAVHYAARFATARSLRGPVNYYRAIPLAPRPAPGDRQRVTVPTTYVWGARDPFLGREAAERTARYVRGPYRFVEVDAGHWLPERHPDVVAAAILDRVLG